MHLPASFVCPDRWDIGPTASSNNRLPRHDLPSPEMPVPASFVCPDRWDVGPTASSKNRLHRRDLPSPEMPVPASFVPTSFLCYDRSLCALGILSTLRLSLRLPREPRILRLSNIVSRRIQSFSFLRTLSD